MNKKIMWPLMDNNIIQEDIEEIIKFLQTPDVKLTQGKCVSQFEQEWSNWLGTKYSLFVNSGASSNLLSLMALKLLHGTGEIIVPSMTWSSDVSSVLMCGFDPIFVDINLNNLAMNTKQLSKSITNNTRAVFLTHALGFNGLTPEMIDICNQNNIPIIEDCCESYGAIHNGSKIGTFGLISNFSFYYGHHMTTIEGGMISTNDESIYQMLRMLRSHGLLRESTSESIKDTYREEYASNDLNRDFIFIYPGFNMRNTEINAVLGLSQLKRLDKNNEIRRSNLYCFLNNLDSNKYFTDFKTEGNCSFCLPVILKNENPEQIIKIINHLDSLNIDHRKGLVSGNILNQPFLKQYRDQSKNFKISNFVQRYSLYVGNYPDLNKDNIISLCHHLNFL